MLNICFPAKVTLEDYISKIYALVIILTDEIFAEKMSYYVISGFKAIESLLKKLGNLLEYSGMRTTSPTTALMITETI